MKRVTVKNLQGVKTHGADFETQEIAEAWAAKEKAAGSFGVLAHIENVPNTGHPAYYDSSGNLLVPAVPPDTVNVPDAFTIEITDVTAEYALNAAIELGLKRQEKGRAILAKVFAINGSKNLSQEVFLTLLSSPVLANIERCLQNGSLTTAKSIIQGMDETYYTTQEKASIISDIDLALEG